MVNKSEMSSPAILGVSFLFAIAGLVMYVTAVAATDKVDLGLRADNAQRHVATAR